MSDTKLQRAVLPQLTEDHSGLATIMNDASIDQILALDTDLKVIAWNKACVQVTGVTKQEATGKLFTDVRIGAADYPQIMEALQMALKGFKSFVAWKQGSYGGGYFEHHFIPLKREGSNIVIGVLNIIHDVAHRIKAEEELKALNRTLILKNKELKHRTDELTQFNWIASHDLKEPLRKIYTFIEMAATKEGQKLSDTARSNLRRAQSSVQRMGLLTDDIVTFSQVTSPDEALAEVDLRHAFIFAQSKHQHMIAAAGAIVTAGQLPVIVGYPDLLQHLWFHLLGNALKFHREVSVPHVSISYMHIQGRDIDSPDAFSDDWYHCLSFEDNGIGFDPAYSEKIFGMFQRLHGQDAYRGTGIGLTICRKIAEAHEGFITVKSEEGKGSVFNCYLKELSA